MTADFETEALPTIGTIISWHEFFNLKAKTYTMKPYPANDVREQNSDVPKTQYAYNDPGRFDVCRCCPLKMAVLALSSNNK